MTEKEKDLLTKDLCARLLYGVIVETPKGKGHLCDINLTIFGYEFGVNVNPTIRDNFSISYIKPYLFPLSSMTEEQYDEYTNMGYSVTERGWSMADYHQIDWLNKNHFDYRGFIEKGLALDATGLDIY